MTAQYESFNFVYATNMLRQIARSVCTFTSTLVDGTDAHLPLNREQAASPALSSIMRKNRVQFLPVQWRSTLKVDQDEERERELEGLTNRFTMDDITPKNTIPLSLCPPSAVATLTLEIHKPDSSGN